MARASDLAPSPENATAARAAFRQGVAAYDASRFVEALSAFQIASGLGASEAHFNLAETHRALDQLPEAIDEYEAFLAAKQGSGPFADEALHAIEELESKVARIDLTAEAGAELTLDGKARALPSAGRPLRIMPGAHAIRVTRPGKIPFHRDLVLAAGERMPIAVELASIDTLQPPPPGGAARDTGAAVIRSSPPARRPFYRSPWFLGGAGAVLVGIVAASAWAMWPHHCELGGNVAACHSY